MSTEQLEERSELTIAKNPFELIQMAAMRPDFDVAKLQQLIELQKQWQADQARIEFAGDMNRCEATMPVVIRDKVNKHTGSSYPSLDAVNLTVKKNYTDNHFSLSFTEGESPLEGHGRMIVKVLHTSGHCEERYMDLPITTTGTGGKAALTPLHAKAAWSTYAQRFLTCLVFSITIADADNDGNVVEELLSEDECVAIRAKILDCKNHGVKGHGDAEKAEARLVAWLAKAQKADATTLEEIQQKQFVTAVNALDKHLRAKLLETAQ